MDPQLAVTPNYAKGGVEPRTTPANLTIEWDADRGVYVEQTTGEVFVSVPTLAAALADLERKRKAKSVTWVKDRFNYWVPQWPEQSA